MDLTTVLILWIVCAVGAYIVATSRNDPSPTMWAVVGFILGPIGLLLAFIAAKPKRASD